MNLMLLATNPFESAAIPIINLLNMILGPAIAIVAALGAVWCIILGVKLAKADEPQEKEKAKGSLRNAIIGYLLIFILIVVLRLSIKPMIEWVNDASKAETWSSIEVPSSSKASNSGKSGN